MLSWTRTVSKSLVAARKVNVGGKIFAHVHSSSNSVLNQDASKLFLRPHHVGLRRCTVLLYLNAMPGNFQELTLALHACHCIQIIDELA